VDLDGTLLRTDGSVSDRTVAALRLADAPVAKLLIRGGGAGAADGVDGAGAADGEQLRRTLASVVGDRLELTRSVGGRIRLVEASAPGVHKGTALAELAASLGIEPAGVVAFGDMPNDLPMLAWAGTGVAMGNADPLLHAVADRVTADNDEDGVALLLEELFG